MSHIIELELSDLVHKFLTKKAQSSGVSTEIFATELLEKVAKDSDSDPLEKFIGAFDSQGSDWADHHDKYIGKAAIEAVDSQVSDK